MLTKPNVILFDMDHTLLSADTVMLWAEFLDQQGIMTPEDWLLRTQFNEDYRQHRLDVEASFRFELDLLRRVPLVLREHWRAHFFEHFVRPRLSRMGLDLIQAYKKDPNTIVILITATHAFLAQPTAAHAQVHHLIATQEEIVDGEYTGRVSGIINLGPGKVKNFHHWLAHHKIIPHKTTFYSDSMNDLPLLCEVDVPIVVDPDPALHQVALDKGWAVMSFKAL